MALPARRRRAPPLPVWRPRENEYGHGVIDAQYPLLLEGLEASQRCGVLTETVRAFPASYPCAATTRCSGSSVPQRPWWPWMPFVIHLTIVYTHGGIGN
jgi:hypothetical protein